MDQNQQVVAPIPGVVYQLRGIDDEDERRSIETAFNGDVLGLAAARQVKIIKTKKNAVLGHHYHRYGELYYLMSGAAVFTLERLDRGLRMVCPMVAGWMLYVPANVAHVVEIEAGAILIGCTEEPFRGDEQVHKHVIDLPEKKLV